MNYWAIPSLVAKPTKAHQKQKADNIIEKISEFYKIPVAKIKGKSRKREYIKPRFIAMFSIRKYTNLTLLTIGEMFERDHSSVIHAIKVIHNINSLKYETDMKEDLKKISELIQFY